MLKAVVICGDRNWLLHEPIYREVSELPKGCVVIEGEAKGADQIARFLALNEGLTVVPVIADWKKYGKAAGPIRNRLMLERLLEYSSGVAHGFHIDIKVIVFHPDIEKSKGTKHMVEIARKANVPVVIHHV